jgi:hypothetical protein
MSKITFSADAIQPEVSILGYTFKRGESREDIDADDAAEILRNANFTDEHGRNAYSDAVPITPSAMPDAAFVRSPGVKVPAPRVDSMASAPADQPAPKS